MLPSTALRWYPGASLGSFLCLGHDGRRVFQWGTTLHPRKVGSIRTTGPRRHEDADQNWFRMAKNCPPDRSVPQDECGNDPFASTPTEPSPPSPAEPQKDEQPSTSGESPLPNVGAMPYYLAAFGTITGAGIGFLSVLLYATADIQFMAALWKVCRRLLKTVALRQLLGVVGAMLFIRFGLEPLVKFSRKLFNTKGTWETSTERDILRDVSSLLSA
jgi:hypothetical protein